MNIFTDIEDLAGIVGPLHLGIGVFDGIHLGHQSVIRLALERKKEKGGEVVVVTFDPHPVTVLCPQNAPRLLTSTNHKAAILNRELGVRHLLAVPFDRKFSDSTGEDFIRRLVAAGSIGSIAVGRDFRFGKDRSGDVTILKQLGSELDFSVESAPIIKVNGITASSTRIREAVAAGDFEIARSLLGRHYTVLGTVIEGRHLGRSIGFPTANLTVHSEQLPPTGVYAVTATGVGDSWKGVANLGYRPTVEGGDLKRLLEVHLFGMKEEIYGQDLEVEFVSFLRGEKKFENLEELKAQIEKDSETARQIFEEEE